MVLVLLLPLIAYGGLIFGRTIEPTPPQLGYYVIEPKNADISVLQGTDRSPEDGEYILRNSTTQEKIPTIYLGELPMGDVAPGQEIIYSDAFHLKNREEFDLHLVCLNFSQTLGTECLAFYIKNDTDGDGNPDGDWVAAWLGNYTFYPANGNQLNSNHYILLKSGGELPVKIIIKIPEKTSATEDPTAIFYGSGKMYLWFKG